jgi:HEAT repeat protein
VSIYALKEKIYFSVQYDLDIMHQNKTNTINILHVEDEIGALEITRLFLKKAGYSNFQITPALNVNDALVKLKTKSFDIIVSDYKMPGMNGIEFLKKIREMDINIPFILFTGKGMDETENEAMSLGANKYLKKEGLPNILFDKLGRYINEELELHSKRINVNIGSQFEGIESEIKSIILALDDKDWTIRKNAAEALGASGNINAIPFLIETIDDLDEDVRVSVIKSLGNLISKIQEIEILSQYDNFTNYRQQEEASFKEVQKLIELLITSLGDSKKNVRNATADAILQIGEIATIPLIKHIQSDSEYIKLGIIRILGEIGKDDSIVPLLKVLKNDLDPYIKWSASEALTKFKTHEKLVDYLIYYLKDKSEVVRWHATEILGSIKTKKATMSLIQSINDKSNHVQIGAIWALGEIQDEYAIDYLINAFTINNQKVQEEAIKSLSKFGKIVNKPLISALNSKNQAINLCAALTLSNIGDKDVMDSIIAAFKEGNDGEKLMAAKSLRLILKYYKKIEPNIQQEVHDFLKPFIETDKDLNYANILKFDTALSEKKINTIRELRAIGYTELQISKKTKTPLKVVIQYLSEGISESTLNSLHYSDVKRRLI